MAAYAGLEMRALEDSPEEGRLFEADSFLGFSSVELFLLSCSREGAWSHPRGAEGEEGEEERPKRWKLSELLDSITHTYVTPQLSRN